jgi:hypothetical protein
MGKVGDLRPETRREPEIAGDELARRIAREERAPARLPVADHRGKLADGGRAIQAILAPETHDRQPETGDLTIETDEFGMDHDLFAKFVMHSLDQLNVCGRRVQHLQIGYPRVDGQGVQRRVIPGQLEDRQRLAPGVGGGALHENGPRPRLQEIAEELHPRFGDHGQNDARPSGIRLLSGRKYSSGMGAATGAISFLTSPSWRASASEKRTASMNSENPTVPMRQVLGWKRSSCCEWAWQA